MKPRALLVVAALAGHAAAQEPFTYEAPGWLFAAADFGEMTGDGLLDLAVLDRARGVLHIGFQRPDGGFDWAAPEPTGMSAPGGLALASFAPVPARQVAVCGAADNRVSVFTPVDPLTPPGIRHAFPGWPSPQWISGFDVDHVGGDDLVVFGDAGGGQVFSEFIGNLDGTPASLWGEAGPAGPERAWTFNRKLGEAPVLALTMGGSFMTAEIGTLGPGSPLVLPGVAAPAGSLMTYGYFDAGALARVVVYSPGQATAASAPVTEATPGSFGWGAVTALTFPKPVRLLVTIPLEAGARLGVLYTDGTAAVFDFNGTALAPRSSLPGAGHELLLPAGNDLMLSLGGGSWQTWRTLPSGGTLSPSAAGLLPATSSATKVSNIVFVNGEPFANPDAEPVFVGHLRDWTLAATAGRSSWEVTALSRGPDGLGDPAILTYPAVPGASHALSNQLFPNVSIRSLEPAAGPAVGDVFISPDAGSYPPLAPGATFPLAFSSTQAGAPVFFRTSAGAAWTRYDPAQAPALAGDGSVEAYARFSSGQSPIRSATFHFGTPAPLVVGSSVDSDGDGLPDQWEAAFNAPDPDGDEDGDGLANLQEFVQGSDPRSGLGLPSGPPVLSATVVGSGTSRMLQLEWPLADILSQLQASDDLTGWTVVGAGITATDTHFRYSVPLADPEPPRRFYRLARP